MTTKNDDKPRSKYIGFTSSIPLSEWLESYAAQEHRSVSGQINLILEAAKSEHEQNQG